MGFASKNSTPQAKSNQKEIKQYIIRDLCILLCKKDELRLMVFIKDINTWNDEAAHLSCATTHFIYFHSHMTFYPLIEMIKKNIPVKLHLTDAIWRIDDQLPLCIFLC